MRRRVGMVEDSWSSDKFDTLSVTYAQDYRNEILISIIYR